MKVGLYSITYRGVWYKGSGIDVFDLLPLAKKQGWEGIELDTERPHAAPMDLSAEDRKRLRGLSRELELPICAVSPNSDLSSPVPSQREAIAVAARNRIKEYFHHGMEAERLAGLLDRLSDSIPSDPKSLS